MKLIDTSAWISFINPKYHSPKNAELRELIRKNEVTICNFVQLELQGYKQSDEKAVRLIIETVPKLELSTDIWDLAFKIARKCRIAGRPVPNSDILIYATAQHHGCQVFHNDKHFDWLAEIVPSKS
ncbi:MAG: putative nucleic acid-binding protein [Zhongshania aliphaticivorans]|jgi:predicted nucleic acid-binding protein